MTSMKAISKMMLVLGICASLITGRAAPASEVELTAAIHALQQAPDPSAAVAAYANGVALDRESPMVHEAYVSRMVEFGLPEMAYRQARTLTGLVSSNGLAWAVLAYVDARRGDMTNAVSEVTLAGRFAAEHPFVQRTAGEIVAWYDLQADKSILPEHVRAGLERVRTSLEKRPAYVAAYDTARKAYQTQPAGATQPQSGAIPSTPSLVETNPPQAMLPSAPVTPPLYYSEPLYAGPVWVDPDPYWWWRPVGYFSGIYFVPYTHVFLYHKHRHHHRHHHRFARHSLDRLFNQRPPHGRWHGEERGRGFYGRPAQPSPSVGQPSWSYLNQEASLAPARPNVPNPTVGQKWATPSWSELSRAGGGPVPKWDGSSPRPRPGVTAPRSPSWSVLGSRGPQFQATPQAVPPRPAPPARAPSWSTLGGGGPTYSAPRSSAPRSSGGSRAPSWSTLDSGRR